MSMRYQNEPHTNEKIDLRANSVLGCVVSTVSHFLVFLQHGMAVRISVREQEKENQHQCNDKTRIHYDRVPSLFQLTSLTDSSTIAQFLLMVVESSAKEMCGFISFMCWRCSLV